MGGVGGDARDHDDRDHAGQDDPYQRAGRAGIVEKPRLAIMRSDYLPIRPMLFAVRTLRKRAHNGSDSRCSAAARGSLLFNTLNELQQIADFVAGAIPANEIK
jgi:hypothetical protein